MELAKQESKKNIGPETEDDDDDGKGSGAEASRALDFDLGILRRPNRFIFKDAREAVMSLMETDTYRRFKSEKRKDSQ